MRSAAGWVTASSFRDRRCSQTPSVSLSLVRLLASVLSRWPPPPQGHFLPLRPDETLHALAR
jgi:hypothetical protein